MRFILLKEIFGIGILISILHFLALKFFLYWNIEWFDIPMHFLGGFLIGIIVISIIRRICVGEEILNKKLLFFSVILSVLVIALSWELWEIFVGFTDIIKDQADTILDLIMGLLGGSVAIFYYYFKYLE